MDQGAWYAVYTRARHEKQVAALLERQHLETYLPLKRVWSSRRDRKVTIQLPALPGYLFVHCTLYAETRALIKRANGVLRLVENAGRPAAIPFAQIDSLRTALAAAFNAEGHPYLNVGDRVRVVRGPMVGVEGYLVRISENHHRLVLAVDYVNQALSVEIDAACVERMEPEALELRPGNRAGERVRIARG
jgi:transcription termination/antitermination protein NusG